MGQGGFWFRLNDLLGSLRAEYPGVFVTERTGVGLARMKMGTFTAFPYKYPYLRRLLPLLPAAGDIDAGGRGFDCYPPYHFNEFTIACNVKELLWGMKYIIFSGP